MFPGDSGASVARTISTVKGRKNWAYHFASKAEAGEPDHHYAKLTAHDAVAAGVLDEAEVEAGTARSRVDGAGVYRGPPSPGRHLYGGRTEWSSKHAQSLSRRNELMTCLPRGRAAQDTNFEH